MNPPYIEKLMQILRHTLRKMQVDTDRSYLLEMNSDGQIRVNGINDIISYDECSVIALSDGLVTEIKGKSLYMLKFSDSEINVSGEIETVNFIRR